MNSQIPTSHGTSHGHAPSPGAAPTAQTAPSRVLIVDDDVALLTALAELLAADGFAVTTAPSAEDALDRLRENTFHLVLCDLQLPGKSGLSLVKTLRETCPATATVLITGHGTVRTAVTALKRGAVEYLAKPIKPRRLLTLCRALTADRPVFLPNQLLVEGRSDNVRFYGLVSRTPEMKSVFAHVEQAARADAPVLLVGEAGTGKEALARGLHARSSRAEGPFVLAPARVDGDPDGTIGPELFGEGDRPGRVERAEGGTLYVEELGALDGETQARLALLIGAARAGRVGGGAERPANVRVVVASRVDPDTLLARGALRVDLHDLLRVVRIEVPPLRERPDDILAIAADALAGLAARQGRAALRLPADTQRLLRGFGWPGNERELRAVVEQAALLAPRDELTPDLLPEPVRRDRTPPSPKRALLQISVGTPMDAVERELILRTLEAHEGNKTAAAETLGISRRSIYNKLASYGIKTDRS